MKKFIYLLAVSLCLAVLTSCEKEEYEKEYVRVDQKDNADSNENNTNGSEDSDGTNGTGDSEGKTFPKVYFKYGGWPFVSNGETLTYELSIDTEKSSEGVYIESIEYHFDEKNLGTVRTAPFGINYAIENETVGIHKLKFIVSVKGGEKYTDVTYTFTIDIHVLERPFVLDFDVNYDEGVESMIEDGIKNGDTISGTVSLSDETSFECDLVKVEYYWDEDLFNATTISPFRFSYKVENQKTGEHKLTFVFYTKSDLGDFTSTQTYTITVKD